MPLLPTSNSPNSTTAPTFKGDEFSNNPLSDLAPLLTLFGERVTNQFLSMSMGWADNLLVALGPLGIVTVVVSAIRVGGSKILKTFVGRPRESKATAELELLSSTSSDVCEVWNGHEIVRQFGVPDTQELIAVYDGGYGPRALDLVEAYKEDYLVESNCSNSLPDEELQSLCTGAPNITLNVAGSTRPSSELWLCVAVGAIAQVSALLLPAVTTYHSVGSKVTLRFRLMVTHAFLSILSVSSLEWLSVRTSLMPARLNSISCQMVKSLFLCK
jgi:hypothetical protein